MSTVTSTAARGLLSLLLFASGVAGADGIGVSAYQTTNTNGAGTTLTTALASPTATNRIVIVGVMIRNGLNQTVNTVTYNGLALTRAGSTPNGTNSRSEIWYRVNPPSGTFNVVVTLSAAAQFGFVATTLSGVHQTTPLGTYTSATGNSQTASVAVTGVNESELVVDALAVRNTTSTWTATTGAFGVVLQSSGGTADSNVFGGGSYRVGGNTYPATSTITNSYTTGNPAQQWALGAVRVRPAIFTEVKTTSSDAYRRASGQTDVVWKTSDEHNHLGFHVWADKPNGERVRLTQSPIAGSGLLMAGAPKMAVGGTYRFLDTSADSESYWLEAIELTGRHAWTGPIVPSAASETSRPSTYSATLAKQSALLVSAPLSTEWVGLTAGAFRSTEPAPLTDGDLARQLELLRGKAIRVKVSAPGWYRLSRASLEQAGMAAGTDFSRVHVYANARELPALSSDAGLELFARGADTPNTGEAVLWIRSEQGPGRRIRQLSAPTGQTIRTSTPFRVERRDRATYFSALINGDADNFFGALITSGGVSQQLAVHHLALAPANAQLEVALQGVSQIEGELNTVQVSVNGTAVGTVEMDGRQHQVATFSIASGLLREGTNVVHLASLTGSGVSLVDSLRLEYAHTLIADAGALTVWADAGDHVSVDGFDDTTVRAFDVTDADIAEVPVTVEASSGSHRATFDAAIAGRRLYLVLGASQSQTPVSITGVAPSPLVAETDGADWLMLGPSELTAAVAPLAAHREAEGLRVRSLSLDSVFDAFAFGAAEPDAIRRFLEYATRNWKTPPKYLLLVGDATFDPRNRLGQPAYSWVPTKLVGTLLLESASDVWFGDLSASGLPSVAVGRFPAHAAADAERLATKTLAFEQALPADGRESHLIISDTSDDIDFETTARAAQAAQSSTLNVELMLASQLSGTPAADVQTRLSSGAGMVTYFGHGSVASWRGNLLTSSSATTLTNARPGVFLLMTCLNGFFQDAYSESLAEALLSAPEGGAAAVWASSALTQPEPQAAIYEAFFAERANETGTVRVGDLARSAKAATQDSDVRASWNLLGDPALVMRAANAVPSEREAPSPVPMGCGGCGAAPGPSFSAAILMLALLGGLRRSRSGRGA